jgi:phage gp29-like protein
MVARNTFSGRLSTAWQALAGRVPDQSPTPLRQASPAVEAAKPEAAVTSGNMFSRSYDGFSIGAAWLEQIAENADTILKREGIQDLKLFDALLDDDVAYSAFSQRVLALVSRPWVVEPGDPEDARSVQAADDLRDMLNGLGWDRVCTLMSYARWYGYGVAEGIFTMKAHNGRTIVWLDDIVVPDRKWFAFTNAGELRMRTPTDVNGVEVPPNKFWSVRVGATHDFAPYGTGLAHWCYWPIWFKRNVLQFWALYLEKYGQPTAVVPFMPGASDEDIAKALEVGKAIGSDSAVAIAASTNDPNGYDLKPHLIEAQRSGGADSYEVFVDKRDDAIRGVILGQPGTSTSKSTGLNSNQTDVHKDVRDEVVKSDSDTLHESFNSTFPTWLTLWNYGPDVAPPTVYRSLEDEEDVDTIADRDSTLDGLGWRRTEESFRETYGDGYERKPEPEPIAPGKIDPKTGKPMAPAANDNPKDQRVAVFAAGDREPLYIYRPLLNTAPVLKWAREQKIPGIEKASDLHVTVCYSREPVDWFDMPEEWHGDEKGNFVVRRGGPRKVERFGQKAIVLMFASRHLQWRHADLVEAGATHDWPEYLPHITIAYDESGDFDPSTVEPYTGELRFGPETWEALQTDPVGPPLIPAFSADQLDQVDRFTADLLDDADDAFAAFGAALRDRIATFTADGRQLTPEALRLAMLQVWERAPLEGLAERMGIAFAAEHAATAIGAEDEVSA